MPSADVVVVGGGAAGIMAALRAAEMGAKVVILEKTPRTGTKILISGGGKCNITHDGPIEEVLKAFRPSEARFIRPCVYKCKPEQTVDLLTSKGLRVYTRPDGRIFPVDQTAKDVVRIFEGYLRSAGVIVKYESPVVGIVIKDGEITGVRVGRAHIAHTGYRSDIDASESEFWDCRSVVICAGGSSYPNSGTTGDAWPWLKEVGHRIATVRAALAPVYIKAENLRADFSGVALRGVLVRARAGGKEIDRWSGDMLFTHQGLSGPTILGVSRAIAERIDGAECTIDVDLFPRRTFEELSAGLVLLAKSPHRKISSWLEEAVPDRLVPAVLDAAGIPMDATFGKLDKKSRNRLVETTKRWELGRVKSVPLDKGECVAGGVSLDDVDPQTMASRKVKGLFLAGEVLDVAGPVGGYNLTAAFATGWVAGDSAAKFVAVK